ncbi:UDP-glucose 4-epimerase GalE [bacterium]|nr:MAG: UDP-glucose 4-epimerase GalE [bacterium]
MSVNILIIGGAGYIGSHVTYLLREKGYKTFVYDNLSTGHKELVSGPFIYGDILEENRLEDVFASHKIDAVIHLAAKSLVSESITKPLFYYENNIGGTLNILKIMLQYGVKRILFSSTASVYGSPTKVPVTEKDEPNPDNVYGFTKLAIERMINEASRIHGFSYFILRYFNAAGAEPTGKFGELHIPETHIIPRVLDVASGEEEHIVIYGTDYDTPDGTCIRDYIHIMDIADAHIRAIEWLLDREPDGSGLALNVGSGKGFSVMDVIKMVQEVTGKEIPIVEGDRRPGDPPKLVAGAELIKKILEWQPRYSDLETIIRTSWKWHTGKRLKILKPSRKYVLTK